MFQQAGGGGSGGAGDRLDPDHAGGAGRPAVAVLADAYVGGRTTVGHGLPDGLLLDPHHGAGKGCLRRNIAHCYVNNAGYYRDKQTQCK